MATTYRGSVDEYDSVEELMRAKFRRTSPHQYIQVFDVWLWTDRATFENREVGSLRLTQAAIKWLGEKKTWNRFWKGEEFPGRKPLDLLERPRVNRTSTQYPPPFRGYDQRAGEFSRDHYRRPFRGRGRGRGRGGMGYRGRTAFVHNTTAHLIHLNNSLPRATIFCRNCGQDSHPETSCPYHVAVEQSRHRERHLTCGRYGHRDFEFGDECEACVRNTLRRARTEATAWSEEEILIGIMDPGTTGVRDEGNAVKKEDPLAQRMRASDLNGKGEGNKQRLGAGNRAGAEEEALIDIAMPNEQEVRDGENAIEIENMLAAMMNGILLDGNEHENTPEDEIERNARTGVGAGEGFLIHVGVPDSESTVKEENTWIGMLSTIDVNVNVNGKRHESAREGEGEGYNRAGADATEDLLIDLEVLDWKSVKEKSNEALVGVAEGTDLIGNSQESFSEDECEEVNVVNGDDLIQF